MVLYNNNTSGGGGNPTSLKRSALSSLVVGGNSPNTQKKKRGDAGSGSWTNLQEYITANQGEGDTMASEITSGIENRVGSTMQNLPSYGQQYQENVLKPYDNIGSERDEMTKILSNSANNTEGGVDIDKTAQLINSWKDRTDPVISSFDDYTRPYVTEDLGKIEDTQQDINTLATDEGRIKQLQNLQNPNATSGATKLNQLIYQTDPNARQRLSDTANQYSNLRGTYDDQLSQLQQNAQNQRQNIEDLYIGTREDAGSIYDTASNAQSDIDQLVQDWQQQYDDIFYGPDVDKRIQFLDAELTELEPYKNDPRYAAQYATLKDARDSWANLMDPSSTATGSLRMKPNMLTELNLATNETAISPEEYNKKMALLDLASKLGIGA